MKTPSFFKAKSRIGLKNKPIHQTELNLGVEDGPEAILSPDFLKLFPGARVSEFEFPKPEDIPEDKFNQVLASSIKEFIELLNYPHLFEPERRRSQPQSRGPNPLPEGEVNQRIVVGGDHSVVLGSILADLARHKDPKKIGVLHIDSHGDINLSQDSPTNNFHGMYLRVLFDRFDIPEIEALIPKKIPTENLMMIGNLDLDPGEIKFLNQNHVIRGGTSKQSLRPEGLKEVPPLENWVNRFKHLHVSFDIDAMDKSIAPATGIPAEHGLLWKDLELILEVIKSHPSFSFDLCEVNPRKLGGKKTVKLAQRILERIIER